MAGSSKSDRYSAWFHDTFRNEEDVIADCMADIIAHADEVGIELPAGWFPKFGQWGDVEGITKDGNGKNVKGKWQYIAWCQDFRGCPGACITFKNFRLNDASGRGSVTWRSGASTWSRFKQSGFTGRGDPRLAEQRAVWAEQRRLAQAQAAASAKAIKDRGHALAAKLAQEAWAAGHPAEGHRYLLHRQVAAHGLRIASRDHRGPVLKKGVESSCTIRRGELLVPMYLNGQLSSVQRIFWGNVRGKDGKCRSGFVKLDITGGRAEGCCYRIEGGPRVVLAEGFSTGASWHQVTGDTVIVCFGASNLPKVAAYLQADLVAADNDAAGEKAAKATGLPFLMPPAPGSDWNDWVRRYGSGELLAGLNGVPVFDNCPGKDARVELKGKASTWWNKYRATETPENAAAWCWSLGLKRVSRIPVQQSLDELMDELRLHAPAGLIRSETFAAVRGCLSRMIEWRRNRALSSVSLSKAVTLRHRHEVHETLPNLLPGEYRGVILLKAPMGSGKTQLIGNPFSLWAKIQPGVFLATCHRRSLVRELANRLGTEHYQEVSADIASLVKALSTCLPSLVKGAHGQIIESTRFLFVDELAQVIRSLEGNTSVADRKSMPEVFDTLREVVAQSECLVGADAGLDDRTLAFLESCRPNERFRIVEVAHQDTGRHVSFGLGKTALAHAYGEVLTHLAAGERLWIGCGEQTRAIEVARVLASSGKRILLLHGDNTAHAASVAFYADPEGQSRRYDAVVHNSVISSGISIEHRGQPHFDRGLFIGSGATVGPADALQMMGRVRYLKSWTVVAMPGHAHDIDDEVAILAACTDAARLEGMAGECTSFDRLKAGIEADKERAKADFAASLWWCLEHQKFTVERLVPGADVLESDIQHTRDALKAEHIQKILAAPNISPEERESLSRADGQTEDGKYMLLRDRIRMSMGMRDLDEDVILAWDNGRGPVQMDRFSAATEQLADLLDSAGPDLTLRRFTKARALAYGLLFKDIDLKPGQRITQSLADLILGRVIEHRVMLAYLGIVGAKYAKDPGQAFQMPAYPLREVGEILGRMGLKTSRRRKNLKTKMGARCPGFLFEITPQSGTQRAIQEVETWYEIDAGSWHKMTWWAERRNKLRKTEEVTPGPDWQSMAFGVRPGIEPKISVGIRHIPEQESSGRHTERTQAPEVPDMTVTLGDPIDRSSIRVTEHPDGPPRRIWSKPSAVIRRFLPSPVDDLDFGGDDVDPMALWDQWSSMGVDAAYT